MLTVLRYDIGANILSSCLLATGRSCLTHLIARYGPDRVILPTLLPEGLIMPFEKAGVAVRHYRLNDDLSPDIADLERTVGLTSGKRPLVVVVHYFGYEMPTCDAAIIAHNAGGVLLADAAHCLMNPNIHTDCADIALYSLNKILPVPDGAFLYSRSPEADVTAPNDLKPIDAEALNPYHQHLLANKMLALSDSRLSFKARALSGYYYGDYYRAVSSDMTPRAPSKFACRAYTEIDFRPVVSKRLSNARRIMNHMRSRQFFRKEGTPIFALPVRCQNRNWTEDRMRRAGIAVEYMRDRWRCLQPDLQFWNSHILVPIHEWLSASDVELIAQTVRWSA